MNRLAGQVGYCGAGKDVKIFGYESHHGEEPAISGCNDSGTIFFSRCTLHCIYCQNYLWSQEGSGCIYDVEELADIFRSIKAASCHNWNLVSPTPWLPLIIQAFELVAQDGPMLPVVYNTSGYERVETVRALKDIVDIYLVDLRYAKSQSAEEGSNAADYVDYARAAIMEMWTQVGSLKLDDNGIAVSGVICRLLILPGHADEVCDNLFWLADSVGTDITLSVMAQYTPIYQTADTSPWNRPINMQEYKMVCELVYELGFHRGWIQDYSGLSCKELVGANMRPVLKHNK